MARPSKKAQSEIVARCMKGFHEDERAHREFCKDVEKRYAAYRAILDRRSDAAQWTSKNHPPYILQVTETMVAGLLDPQPKWKLRALPRAWNDPDWQMIEEGVRANETLLAYQLDCDHFVEKQRPFSLQALIAGLTVGKDYWRFEEGVRHRQEVVNEDLYDDAGTYLRSIPKLTHKPVTVTIHDDPTFEVVDVRDFIWHAAAPSLERAARVCHRVWMTKDELKRLVKAGRFNQVSDVKAIEDLEVGLRDASEYVYRDKKLFEQSRTKDMCEVLEHWIDYGRRRVTIVNRTLLLDDRPNPFWHGQYPFTVASAMPDLFRIPGISDVELINDIQEMMWTLQNQRLDAVQLLNNPVVMFRDDFDDPDSFEFFPGARNIVADPSQVNLWTPPILENRSIEHENMLKDDLQSIPGASPTMLGQLPEGSTTATQASLTSTLAQRRLANKKLQLSLAYARVGEHWIALNQQFITEERLVPIIGKEGASDFVSISPMVIQGQYKIKVDQLDESLIRQERTAESMARVQMALQIAPVAAALSQNGTAKMVNLDAFVEDWLRSYDITDTNRYFTAAKPPMLPQGQGQAPTGQAASPNGITAPQATDENSPSSPFSQSPVMAMQRQAAMAGGPVNG